ncbi:MAG: c-type cytochrome [Bacteroidia bacterium]|nr:c-type cytochrome [Bacteroidia bacterium]
MNAKNINNYRNGIITLGLMVLPFISSAQENEVATVSYFSNALFNTLLTVIILLAILIVALSGVMKNIANSDMFYQKLKKRADANAAKKAMGMALLFSLMSLSSFAADGANAAVSDRIGGVDQFTFYTMVSVIILEVIFIGVMLFTMASHLKADEVVLPDGVKIRKEKTILDKFISDAVEVEDEESVLMDHDYDGIKELDNNLPPWWKYGFYLTIVVAFVYLINYHVTGSSPLQGDEYKIAMKQADEEVAAYLKNSANNVDETTVKMLDNASDLAAGKEIFQSICKTCHGALAEGNKIGPNLTDDYWLHSGGIKDIFKTIKYGWPEKGMQSWKDQYTPMQIAQVSSYIKSLRGTNPPNAKEPQGDLYTEQAAAPADSTAVVTDSTKIVNAVIDSLKTKK